MGPPLDDYNIRAQHLPHSHTLLLSLLILHDNTSQLTNKRFGKQFYMLVVRCYFRYKIAGWSISEVEFSNWIIELRRKSGYLFRKCFFFACWFFPMIGNYYYLSQNLEKRKDLNIICQNWHSEVISFFFDQFSRISRILDRHFYQSWHFFLYCFGNVALTSIKGNNTRCKERNCEKTCHVKKFKNKCKNNNCASCLTKTSPGSNLSKDWIYEVRPQVKICLSELFCNVIF